MSDSPKVYLSGIVVGVVIAAMGVLVAAHLMAIPRYLDRTDQEQEKLTIQAFAQMGDACREAGGTFFGGSCTVRFKQPDLSKFLPPIENPARTPAINFAGALFALCAVGGALIASYCVVSLVVDGIRAGFARLKHKLPFVPS